MEKESTNSLSHGLSLADTFVFLSFYILFDWIIRIQNSSQRFLSLLRLCAEFFSYSPRINTKEPIANASTKVRGDQGLNREDVAVVLERLSMSCSQEGEQLKEYMSFDEISAMFGKEEPSLDEVRVTFSVFDENGDGFIDATELQRVLSKLGLVEGFSLDDCKQMIAVHDENKDVKIDFSEFVKLLESSMC